MSASPLGSNDGEGDGSGAESVGGAPVAPSTFIFFSLRILVLMMAMPDPSEPELSAPSATGQPPGSQLIPEHICTTHHWRPRLIGEHGRVSMQPHNNNPNARV